MLGKVVGRGREGERRDVGDNVDVASCFVKPVQGLGKYAIHI